MSRNRTRWLEKFLIREGQAGSPENILSVTEKHDHIEREQVEYYEQQLASKLKKTRETLEGLARCDRLIQERVQQLKKRRS